MSNRLSIYIHLCLGNKGPESLFLKGKLYVGNNSEGLRRGLKSMNGQPDGKEKLEFFGHALLISEPESLLHIFQVFVSVPDIQDP